MKIFSIIIPIFVVLTSIPVSGAILNVPGDFARIQEALDAYMITDGDTVLVQPGVYLENINFRGYNVTVGSLFLTTGERSYITSTIIDGDSSGSVITFENDEDSSAAIIGFTISNGYAENGGGIFCFYSAPVIMENIISENAANSEGGGIFCFYSNPSIKNNVIQENSATSGGGIDCRFSNPIISDNLLIGNGVSWEGGGIFCRDNSSPLIKNNHIRENWADDGGGILCRYSDPLIINTVISSNSANRGGGIFFTGSDPSVANVAISGNSGEYGGGIFCLNSSPFLTNAILWYNVADEGAQIYGDSPQITYSDIQGGWEGPGNIDVAPLFRDTTGGDFHIMSIACGDSSDSPCIDAGDPAVSDSLLDCSWGLGTTDSDMGAYGGGGSMTGIDEEIPDVSRRLALSRNYPNPFNVSTSL
ncbi:MAG: right-handed parallel beta-helix repeat-containing protein, partial [candidate division Zixibacteria bacterium]